ncbi:MAG: ATP synthase F1 subunit epsilon [Proteobacteria bacterium]|nr:ATP synthase F1 subunit epsilon [Pseudomonadota bacterium]
MPVSLEIVSPEKLLVAQAVDMVVIPASEGDIGVLPEHSPMIVLLRGGEVILYEGEQVTARFFVTGGFAEITEERCTVLADTAEPSSSIDRAAGERQLQEATRELAEAERAGNLDGLAPIMERVQVAQAIVDLGPAQ